LKRVINTEDEGKAPHACMYALVFVGSLSLVPLVAWLTHGLRPENSALGRDPGTAVATCWIGVLIGWAGFAIIS
jgi:hypothetical protein